MLSKRDSRMIREMINNANAPNEVRELPNSGHLLGQRSNALHWSTKNRTKNDAVHLDLTDYVHISEKRKPAHFAHKLTSCALIEHRSGEQEGEGGGVLMFRGVAEYSAGMFGVRVCCVHPRFLVIIHPSSH